MSSSHSVAISTHGHPSSVATSMLLVSTQALTIASAQSMLTVPAFDWRKEVFGKTGITQNHNVSISGGNEKARYLLSCNYTGENGIMEKHGYEKNSIRLKIDRELWKSVRFDMQTALHNTQVDGSGSLGGTLKHTVLQPVTGGNLWANEDLLHKDLSDEYYKLDASNSYDANNPLISNSCIDNKKLTRFASVNAGVDIDIIKNLTFRTTDSYTWQQVRRDYWDNGGTKSAQSAQSLYGYGYHNNSEKTTWQWTNTLNYAFNINEDHKFAALACHEIRYNVSMNLNNEYRKFSDGNFGLNDVSMVLLMSGSRARIA